VLLRLNVSQIFIPKPKQAANFVSVYEESVRTDTPVTLFIVVEVVGEQKNPATKRSDDYEKLALTLARSLKHTYLTETKVNEYTFEKALANVNQELSNLAHRGITGWYKKLNAVIGAFYKGMLTVSVAGTASAMLLRDNEYTEVSALLSSGSKPHPLKTFVNFASGQLVELDIVLLGTVNLYNYISLERIREVFSELPLGDASKQFITLLQKDALPDQPFATFIAKASARAEFSDEELQPLMAPASHTIIEEPSTVSSARGNNFWKGLAAGAKFLERAVKSVVPTSNRANSSRHAGNGTQSTPSTRRFHMRPSLLIALGIVALLLAGSIAYFNLRKADNEVRDEIAGILAASTQKVVDAEAALIYNDRDAAFEKIRLARQDLEAIQTSGLFAEDTEALSSRIETLENRLNLVTKIEAVEELGQFSNTPNWLIRTADGFVVFNDRADSFERYQSGAGVTKIEFQEPLPANLVAGTTGENGQALFISSTAGFYTLANDTNNFSLLAPTSTETDIDPVGLEIYGSRAYTINRTGSQIMRFAQNQESYANPTPWLTSLFDMNSARDLAIDGDLYVLFPEQLIKFTSGRQQSFSLPQLTKATDDLRAITTDVDKEFIYLADGANDRILILTKSGSLAVQLVSDEFTDIKDLWVDETSKTMYVLAAGKLLRFGY